MTMVVSPFCHLALILLFTYLLPLTFGSCIQFLGLIDLFVLLFKFPTTHCKN